MTTREADTTTERRYWHCRTGGCQHTFGYVVGRLLYQPNGTDYNTSPLPVKRRCARCRKVNLKL